MDTSLYLTTRATTVIRSRFSIPRAIESPRPARTWSDRALLLRRRDTSITFLAPRGPHEACAPLGTLFIGLRGPWMMGTFVGSVAVSRFGVEVTTPPRITRCSSLHQPMERSCRVIASPYPLDQQKRQNHNVAWRYREVARNGTVLPAVGKCCHGSGRPPV